MKKFKSSRPDCCRDIYSYLFLLMSFCLLILRFVIPGFHNLFIPAVTALFFWGHLSIDVE